MSEIVTTEEHLRKQAWDYFQVHSAQRLTTFNFYLGLSAATTAAVFITFQRDYRVPSVGIILSLLLVFFSFVFWKLDGRNRELIKLSEEALRFFEEKSDLPDEGSQPHKAKLFSREALITGDRKKTQRAYGLQFWKKNYSYATCFKAVIWLFGLTGLSGFVLSCYFAFLGWV